MCIRDDYVSTEKLIELSMNEKLKHTDLIMKAICKRLAREGSAQNSQITQEILKIEMQKPRIYMNILPKTKSPPQPDHVSEMAPKP